SDVCSSDLGVGDLTKTGTGTLYLGSGAGGGGNGYTGATHLNGGTVLIDNDTALGVGGSLTFDGGTLAANDAGIISGRNMTLNPGGGTIDTQENTFELDGNISGAGSLTVADSMQNGGVLYLTGSNDYSGGTFINGAGVQAGAQDVLGTGPVTMTSQAQAAVLDLNGFNQAIGSLTGDASSLVHMSGGATLTTGGDKTSTQFDGVINGDGSLVKTGNGVFTLTAVSTYTGGTTISGGTMQAGAENVFASASDFRVNEGATLDLNTHQQTIGSLAGAGTVDLNGAQLTTGGNNNPSTTFSGLLADTAAGGS